MGIAVAVGDGVGVVVAVGAGVAVIVTVDAGVGVMLGDSVRVGSTWSWDGVGETAGDGASPGIQVQAAMQPPIHTKKTALSHFCMSLSPHSAGSVPA
jgi:hypothetical protein